MSENEHVALAGRQRGKRFAERRATLERRLVGVLVDRPDLLAREHSRAPHMVDRRVVGYAQDPGAERRLAGLVAPELGEELGEDLLREVVGVVGIDDDALDAVVHLWREAHVELTHGVVVARLCPLDEASNGELLDGGDHLCRDRRYVPLPLAEHPLELRYQPFVDACSRHEPELATGARAIAAGPLGLPNRSRPAGELDVAAPQLSDPSDRLEQL